MAKKYLDYDGLLYFWQSIKSLFVADVTYDSSTNYIKKTKGGQSTNVVQLPSGVSPSTTTPKMDGTAAKGTETAFARGDHVHPTDTSRAPKSHASTATTYGAGNGTNYGHVKLSDTYISTDDASSGKAATPKAVEVAFEQACDYADGVAGDTNVLEGVQMDGTDLTIINKKVNIPIVSLNSKGVLPTVQDGSDGYYFPIAIKANNSATVEWDALEMAYANGTGTISLGIAGDPTAIVDATIPLVSTTVRGLMSSGDKSKLDSISMTNGIIDSSCLPSFVDDVIEAYARPNQTELGSTWLATGSAGGTVITPEAGKIYVLMNSSTNYEQNTQFRWGGTAYVQLNDSGCTAITNSEIDTILGTQS